MPIIERNGMVFVEYKIPKEIDEKIPEYFYHAMAGELCSIHGPRIFEKVECFEYDDEGNETEKRNEELDYYDLDSGTGGWFEAFRMTCDKLGLAWLLEYWDELEWYDSDIFDGIIEERIVEKVIEAEPSNCNAYYKYLVGRDRS